MGVYTKYEFFTKRYQFDSKYYRNRIFTECFSKIVFLKVDLHLKKEVQNYSLLWGEVKNEQCVYKRAGMRTPDGYTFTAISSTLIAKKSSRLT
jgi:hypothetical protein